MGSKELVIPLNRPLSVSAMPDGSLLMTEKNGQLVRHSCTKGARRVIPLHVLPADVDRKLESAIDSTGVFDVAWTRTNSVLARPCCLFERRSG